MEASVATNSESLFDNASRAGRLTRFRCAPVLTGWSPLRSGARENTPVDSARHVLEQALRASTLRGWPSDALSLCSDAHGLNPLPSGARETRQSTQNGAFSNRLCMRCGGLSCGCWHASGGETEDSGEVGAEPGWSMVISHRKPMALRPLEFRVSQARGLYGRGRRGGIARSANRGGSGGRRGDC